MSSCNGAQTEVKIMWTNQHGTGPDTNDIVKSQVILQYMCQKDKDIKDFEYHRIRNGKNHERQDFSDRDPEKDKVKDDRGLQEPFHFYQANERRDRNRGERVLQPFKGIIVLGNTHSWDKMSKEEKESTLFLVIA